MDGKLGVGTPGGAEAPSVSQYGAERARINAAMEPDTCSTNPDENQSSEEHGTDSWIKSR